MATKQNAEKPEEQKVCMLGHICQDYSDKSTLLIKKSKYAFVMAIDRLCHNPRTGSARAVILRGMIRGRWQISKELLSLFNAI